MVEQLTLNQRVVGSSPTGETQKIQRVQSFYHFVPFFFCTTIYQRNNNFIYFVASILPFSKTTIPINTITKLIIKFNRNEICILQLKFHYLSLFISIHVHHHFCTIKNHFIYVSEALVFLCPKKEFVKCLIIIYLFSIKFSCRSFASTNYTN